MERMPEREQQSGNVCLPTRFHLVKAALVRDPSSAIYTLAFAVSILLLGITSRGEATPDKVSTR